jgi:hypothetical protein
VALGQALEDMTADIGTNAMELARIRASRKYGISKVKYDGPNHADEVNVQLNGSDMMLFLALKGLKPGPNADKDLLDLHAAFCSVLAVAKADTDVRALKKLPVQRLVNEIFNDVRREDKTTTFSPKAIDHLHWATEAHFAELFAEVLAIGLNTADGHTLLLATIRAVPKYDDFTLGLECERRKLRLALIAPALEKYEKLLEDPAQYTKALSKAKQEEEKKKKKKKKKEESEESEESEDDDENTDESRMLIKIREKNLLAGHTRYTFPQLLPRHIHVARKVRGQKKEALK